MKNRRGPLSVKQLDAAIDLMGRTGRLALLPVTGDSMLPSLHEDQSIAVELLPGDPDFGDILVFRQMDYLVVHRFLGPASREDGHPLLRTRGDNIPTLDPALERGRVRGRVVAFESDGRWWSLDTGGARLWALAVGAHDLTWSFAGAVAGRLDARARRVGVRTSLGRWIGRLDRFKLRLAYRLFFWLLHRRCAERPEDLPGRGRPGRALNGDP